LILVSADSASQVNYVHLVAAFRAVPNGIGVVYTLGMRAHRSLRDYGVFAREQFFIHFLTIRRARVAGWQI
jgi:hypothetical protein